MAETVEEVETMALRDRHDVVRARRRARDRARALGFGTTDQTRVMTAASELARNTLTHGRGGTVRLETVRRGGRSGLRLCFEDTGPGIDDVEMALTDGFTSTGGLGLGLGGARRLADEMDVESTGGLRTTVRWLRWRR